MLTKEQINVKYEAVKKTGDMFNTKQLIADILVANWWKNDQDLIEKQNELTQIVLNKEEEIKKLVDWWVK